MILPARERFCSLAVNLQEGMVMEYIQIANQTAGDDYDRLYNHYCLR